MCGGLSAEGRGWPIDRQMLARLYERYSRELYLYIYSMCRSPEMAEDILQETFLKALLSRAVAALEANWASACLSAPAGR